MPRLLALLAAAIALLIPSALPAISAPARTYNHFLFLRHNTAGGLAVSHTLVMARVAPTGFGLKDIHGEENLHVGLDPLGVFGGKAYGLHLDSLLSLDLSSGRYARIASHIHRHAYADGRLFTLDPKGVIRQYDLRTQAYRELHTIPSESFPNRLAVSPDARRLAFFLPLEPQLPEGDCQLNILDVDKRTVRGLTIASYQHCAASSGLSGGPPLAWLDPTTLLFVHTDNAFAFDFARHRLVAVNTDTGELKTIALVPGQPAVVFVHLVPAAGTTQESFGMYLPPPGPQSLLVVSGQSAAGGIFAIDVDAGKLVEAHPIGGGFSLRHQPNPDGSRSGEIYHGDRLLAQTASYIRAAVSPDQHQVIWTDAWHGPLQYYDARVGAVRTVAEGWFGDVLLWFAEEDLAFPEQPREPPPGWSPL